MKDLQGRSIKIINKTCMCSDGMIYKKRIKSKKNKIAKDNTGKMQDKLHINPHRPSPPLERIQQFFAIVICSLHCSENFFLKRIVLRGKYGYCHSFACLHSLQGIQYFRTIKLFSSLSLTNFIAHS